MSETKEEDIVTVGGTTTVEEEAAPLENVEEKNGDEVEEEGTGEVGGAPKVSDEVVEETPLETGGEGVEEVTSQKGSFVKELTDESRKTSEERLEDETKSFPEGGEEEKEAVTADVDKERASLSPKEETVVEAESVVVADEGGKDEGQHEVEEEKRKSGEAVEVIDSHVTHETGFEYDHEIFGVGEEHQKVPEEEEEDFEEFFVEDDEVVAPYATSEVEEEEYMGKPFDFKAYVQKHEEFFKTFEKRKVEVCAEGSDTALVKVELDDLIRGYKSGLEKSLARDSTAGLMGHCRIREGISLFADERVVVRTDHEKIQGVKLVTGGHTGRDPLYAAYVGSGMMTAAVMGTDLDAPKVGSILNAIREIYSDKGVLIVVQNSAEYRLCFGLAMERARLEGMKQIDMVTVGEDCYEKAKSPVGKRGLGGIVLAYKVAGSMADRNVPLLDIFNTVRQLGASEMATISALTEPDMVIGTGMDRTSTDGTKFEGDLHSLAKEMLSYPLDLKRYFSLKIDPDVPMVVMINSYKGNYLELHTVVDYVLDELEDRGLKVCRVYGDRFAGGYWPGFSLTLMVGRPHLLECLDWPTGVNVWPRGKATGAKSVTWCRNLPLYPWLEDTGPSLTPDQEEVVERALVHSAKALYICESLLNTIHLFGTYGTHLKCAAEGVLSGRQRGTLSTRYPFNMFISISNIVQDRIPGFNGAMFGCLFSGAAQSFLRNSLQLVNKASWADALEQGLRTLRAYSNNKHGIASLALTLIPLVQQVYGDAAKNELGHETILKSLDSLRKGLEERMKQEDRLDGNQSLLKNQMDVESYALIVCLEALITAIHGRAKTKTYSEISFLDSYVKRIGVGAETASSEIPLPEGTAASLESADERQVVEAIEELGSVRRSVKSQRRSTKKSIKSVASNKMPKEQSKMTINSKRRTDYYI